MNFHFSHFDKKKTCGVNFVSRTLLKWLYILIYSIWCLFFMLISRFILKKNLFWITGPIPSPVVNATARAMTSRKIEVEWETTIEHEYLNVTYIVTLSDVNGRYRREEEVALNRCVIRNLTESTEYRIYVVAVTPEGLRSSESDVISVVTEKSLPKPTLHTLFWNDTVIMTRP